MNSFILKNKKVFGVFILGLVCGILFHALISNFGSEISSFRGGDGQSVLQADPGDLSIAIPMIPYPEKPWRTSATISARTVASTPFARFEIHRVKAEDGHVVEDWLWQDERSHVNILVHLKEENKYLIFKQRKYGFEGPRLAVVGGLFGQPDTPIQCAHRELLEETGLEAGELVDLGSYRVQANRGGGILHAFLARNCVKSLHKAAQFEADYEHQDVILVTAEQLTQKLMAHEFGEAQHAGVVALGLLQEQQGK